MVEFWRVLSSCWIRWIFDLICLIAPVSWACVGCDLGVCLTLALYMLLIRERASFIEIFWSVATLIRFVSSRKAGHDFESDVWVGLLQLTHFWLHSSETSWAPPHGLLRSYCSWLRRLSSGSLCDRGAGIYCVCMDWDSD